MILLAPTSRAPGAISIVQKMYLLVATDTTSLWVTISVEEMMGATFHTTASDYRGLRSCLARPIKSTLQKSFQHQITFSFNRYLVGVM